MWVCGVGFLTPTTMCCVQLSYLSVDSFQSHLKRKLGDEEFTKQSLASQANVCGVGSLFVFILLIFYVLKLVKKKEEGASTSSPSSETFTTMKVNAAANNTPRDQGEVVQIETSRLGLAGQGRSETGWSEVGTSDQMSGMKGGESKPCMTGEQGEGLHAESSTCHVVQAEQDKTSEEQSPSSQDMETRRTNPIVPDEPQITVAVWETDAEQGAANSAEFGRDVQEVSSRFFDLNETSNSDVEIQPEEPGRSTEGLNMNRVTESVSEELGDSKGLISLLARDIPVLSINDVNADTLVPQLVPKVGENELRKSRGLSHSATQESVVSGGSCPVDVEVNAVTEESQHTELGLVNVSDHPDVTGFDSVAEVSGHSGEINLVGSASDFEEVSDTAVVACDSPQSESISPEISDSKGLENVQAPGESVSSRNSDGKRCQIEAAENLNRDELATVEAGIHATTKEETQNPKGSERDAHPSPTGHCTNGKDELVEPNLEELLSSAELQGKTLQENSGNSVDNGNAARRPRRRRKSPRVPDLQLDDGNVKTGNLTPERKIESGSVDRSRKKRLGSQKVESERERVNEKTPEVKGKHSKGKVSENRQGNITGKNAKGETSPQGCSPKAGKNAEDKGEKSGQARSLSQKKTTKSICRAEAKEFVPSGAITKRPAPTERRKTKSREQKTSCADSEKVLTEIPTKTKGTNAKVLVTIQGSSPKDKKTMQEYLSTILPDSLTFKIFNMWPVDEGDGLHLTLDFPSIKKAQRAVTVFGKTSSRTGVTAQMLGSHRQVNKEELIRFIEEQKKDVINKGEAEALRHQVKIDELTLALNKLSVRKPMPLDAYEARKAEREAVKSKLEEVTNQMEEFRFRFQQIVASMHELVEQVQTPGPLKQEEHHSKQDELSPKQEILKLRMEFGKECRKLETGLPIFARRREILQVVSRHPVSVILGETGSGKSTQLVQYVSQAEALGFGSELGSKLIVCTEPRKVAAQSLADHVANEMGTHCGEVVGYKTGLQSKISPQHTKVIYTTDHSLLNECLKDPNLEQYSCIIIDEAHERSIYTDLLLGMIKKCLAVRTDLRVVITSATIDPEVFVRYFPGAPVLRVSGRVYPVEVVYQDPSEPVRDDYVTAAVERAISIHLSEREGDVLVFLTSPLETQIACERMMTSLLHAQHDVMCLPLHGQLQMQEQRRVFETAPPGVRKIVFATNSAETSITIPGIRYVVDTGRVKEKVFDPKRNMSALVVKETSRSSADQRKGRAGRMSAGKCYRLYTEQDYRSMDAMTLPEILRVHLGQALLKLMEVGISDPLQFEFVQSPSLVALENAMKILIRLGAVNPESGITDLGKRMALLPVEPRMAKMIFDAIAQGFPLEGIAIAAFSSVSGNVFFRMGTEEEKKMADFHKTRFCQPGGDIETFFTVYKEWDLVPEQQKSRWCVENFINGKSIRACRETIHDIRKTLKKELNTNIPYTFSKDSGRIQGVLSRILLSSYKSNIGYFTGHERVGYYVVNDEERRFLQIHPSASLSSLASAPQWLVFLDVLKTSKDFMMSVVSIEEEMIQSEVNTGGLSLDWTRLQEVTLAESVVAEVGRSLMSSLIGPRYSVFNSIQTELSSTYGQPVVLEIEREKSRIKAFASQELFQDIKAYLSQKMDSERVKLKREFQEVQLVAHSRTRAEIGNGGKCCAILMSDETRSVILRDVPREWNQSEILTEFGPSFGEIFDVIPFRGGGVGNKPWGKVIFTDTSAVKRLMEFYQGDLRVTPEGIVGGGNAAAQRNEFKVRLQWCRRPTRGFAFVTPRDPEDALRLAGRRRVVSGVVVDIKMAKNDSTKLFIPKIAADITEEEVKNVLSLDIPIQEVRMPRTKPEETKPEMLQALKGQLNMKILELADKEEFNLMLLQPKPTNCNFLGYAVFTNPEKGMAVVNSLHGTQFQNTKLTVRAELRSSLHVQKFIYSALREPLENLIADIQLNNKGVRIQVRELKSGHFVINLDFDEADAMVDIRGRLHDLISGERLECESAEEQQALFSFAGRDLLENLQKQVQGLFVRADGRLRQVTLYGTADVIRRAKENVTQFLTRFQSLKTVEVALKGDGRPPGLMRRFLMDYGLEMVALQQETEVEMLNLVLQKHLLRATGSHTATEKLISKVNEVAKELVEASGNEVKTVDDDEVECMVCFCPVEGPVYRLEYCGHAYCPECVLNLIRNGIKNREFPILCAGEACHSPLVVKDFLDRLDPGLLSDLHRSAVEDFVAQNKETHRFCESPDCPMVYRVSETDSGTALRCEGCGVTYCTACHVQYHFGLTCAMYRSKLRSRDYDLKEWIREDPANRAACPGCKAHIEKNGGCMHVQCTACKVHVCWRCRRTFTSGDQTYDHLASCGGIFADEENQ